MGADWHFPQHTPGPVSNLVAGEHFSGEKEAGESLVRECIQNSSDARLDGEEVSVTIHVGRVGDLAKESGAFWFGTLWPHLKSRDCKLHSLEPKPFTGTFIVVEDFGTRGLDGDVTRWQLSDNADNNFFSFFRAEGFSGKRAGSGGSWGVGKSVFNRCSGINSYLAVTVPADGRPLLIGNSLLWYHRVGNDQYQGVGQYGVIDPKTPGLVLPATEGSLIRRAATDFKLRRPLGLDGSEAASGTSIIIPYPQSDPQISARSLLSIVLREYFQPILAGRLRVTVAGSGLAGPVVLDRDTIRTEAVTHTPEIVRIVELAAWAGECDPLLDYRADEQDEYGAPGWNEGTMKPRSPEFADLSDKFSRGEQISIRVPLRVHPRVGRAEMSHFRVSLRRDLEGEGATPFFVRQGIVIPNVRKRSVRDHALYSLVTIDDPPLATMLRAAEPPAHNDWLVTENARGMYEYLRQTIDFVVGAPRAIAEALSNARSERDLDVWADLFPAPDPNGRLPFRGREKKGRTEPQTIIKPPQPVPKPFRIESLRDGFRVQRDNPKSTPLPAQLEVMVAYDTSVARSASKVLGNHDKADFALTDLKRAVGGAQEVECGPNRLVLAPDGDDFSLEIAGFDPNRDLLVKVRVVEPVEVA